MDALKGFLAYPVNTRSRMVPGTSESFMPHLLEVLFFTYKWISSVCERNCPPRGQSSCADVAAQLEMMVIG